MAMTPSPRTRKIIALATAGVACAGIALTATTPAVAAPQAAKPRPVVAHSPYLALGDSVPFGYREPTSMPTPDPSKPNTIVGYPEMIARDLKLNLTNAACPGETTASFINKSKQSNGCESSPGGGPGYRTAYPLKASYTGSQLGFARRFLKHHPNTRLITLMVGANDGLLCQETTTDNCQSPSELLGVLSQIQKNLSYILDKIRNQAGYTGQIVLVGYYSTDYTDTSDGGANQQSLALDQVIKGVGQQYDATYANGYGAFRTAAQNAGGSTCNAGLLTYTTLPTPTSAGTCGIHPSLGGHALLAGAVERKLTY